MRGTRRARASTPSRKAAGPRRPRQVRGFAPRSPETRHRPPTSRGAERDVSRCVLRFEGDLALLRRRRMIRAPTRLMLEKLQGTASSNGHTAGRSWEHPPASWRRRPTTPRRWRPTHRLVAVTGPIRRAPAPEPRSDPRPPGLANGRRCATPRPRPRSRSNRPGTDGPTLEPPRVSASPAQGATTRTRRSHASPPPAQRDAQLLDWPSAAINACRSSILLTYLGKHGRHGRCASDSLHAIELRIESDEHQVDLVRPPSCRQLENHGMEYGTRLGTQNLDGTSVLDVEQDETGVVLAQRDQRWRRGLCGRRSQLRAPCDRPSPACEGGTRLRPGGRAGTEEVGLPLAGMNGSRSRAHRRSGARSRPEAVPLRNVETRQAATACRGRSMMAASVSAPVRSRCSSSANLGVWQGYTQPGRPVTTLRPSQSLEEGDNAGTQDSIPDRPDRDSWRRSCMLRIDRSESARATPPRSPGPGDDSGGSGVCGDTGGRGNGNGAGSTRSSRGESNGHLPGSAHRVGFDPRFSVVDLSPAQRGPELVLGDRPQRVAGLHDIVAEIRHRNSGVHRPIGRGQLQGQRLADPITERDGNRRRRRRHWGNESDLGLASRQGENRDGGPDQRRHNPLDPSASR